MISIHFVINRVDENSIFFLPFSFSDWADKDEDAGDVNVWEDNWDDDNVEDDFSRQLRYHQF